MMKASNRKAIKHTKALLLEQAEARMLRNVRTPLKFRMVRIPKNFVETKHLASVVGDRKATKTYEISTVSTAGEGARTKPVCVLVHGWAGGKAIFVRSFDDLAQHFQVYAIDLLGWGRSSRPKYRHGADPQKAQEWWVESLEAWRVSMGIERFTLVGHSMGGFVGASYALKYRDRLDKLVLVSPIGLKGFNVPSEYLGSFAAQLFVSSVWRFTPQRLVSILPRKRIIKYLSNARPDLVKAFPYADQTAIMYLYHLAAQGSISGENAFRRLTTVKGFSLPLKDELHKLGDLPVNFVYGEHDWIDPAFGLHIKEEVLPNAKVYILHEAGHHVYVERWMEFNEIIINGEKQFPQCWVKEFDPRRGSLRRRSLSIA